MTCTKFSNFNMTHDSYQPLVKAIRDQRIVMKEDQCRVLISRPAIDFKLPVGMRNYLRKNGYDISYFDFPDVELNLTEEDPFEGRVRDIVGRALEGTGVDLTSIDREHGNSHAAPVLLSFESHDCPLIPQLDVGLAFENGTQVRVLEMKIRDYVMQQKRREI
ncbi:MAG TPA: hypothetical protein VFC63_11030 [Blastocatellia bacterium]|nr:hypothetical protein [Blastocatellia bacterium]